MSNYLCDFYCLLFEKDLHKVGTKKQSYLTVDCHDNHNVDMCVCMCLYVINKCKIKQIRNLNLKQRVVKVESNKLCEMFMQLMK